MSYRTRLYWVSAFRKPPNEAGHRKISCNICSSVKNSSPHTILNYGKDLEQFVEYLSPPGVQPPALTGVTHHIIREFVGASARSGAAEKFHRAKAGGAAIVFQVLRARRAAEGKSGATGSHAETAEAHSVACFPRKR